jgi:hypothetical protein
METVGRAAVAGVEEGEQVVEMDIQPVPRQDSRRDTYASEHAANGSAVATIANGGGSGRLGYFGGQMFALG